MPGAPCAGGWRRPSFVAATSPTYSRRPHDHRRSPGRPGCGAGGREGARRQRRVLRREGEPRGRRRSGVGPGLVRRGVVDPSFFTGNYPESCELAAAVLDGDPDADTPWSAVVPRTVLEGSTRIPIDLERPFAATHLRFVIHPDGGVARLRGLGDPTPGSLDGSLADLARPAP